ncbi:hypothetical protein F753_14110 [Stutzerimonas chloritidismutans AW-1]|uniref:Lipoprotein n=1 Tax=Stutzerimonas chloritidismutans AW-1 TaxID=1263865 RepID=V4QFY0_STUCH|nr:hypothetical protein F753_14110 [Stutzerimonas chloritidismutans AW-1]MAF87945.1 hypothetical protein [Pseudomonas sp.]MBD3874661.1 hypothetical protein [Stutzerimonas kunmingensis]MBU0920819.1 hypothetical protein [Gammaproteobacteria bacterium]RSH65612.1 hypothetical protein EGV02_15310 [Stutzerimonas stutzeri]
MFAALVLVGCQSDPGQPAGDGYPPAYLEGYGAGCSSGRQAAGAMAAFRKDVSRYLSQPLYAQGWDDGYRQCEALPLGSGGLPSRRGDAWQRQRDREWRHQVDQDRAEAFHR